MWVLLEQVFLMGWLPAGFAQQPENGGRVLQPDITAGLARLASFRQGLGEGKGLVPMIVS